MSNGVDNSVIGAMVPDTEFPNTAVTATNYCIGQKVTWREADGGEDVVYSRRFSLRRHAEMAGHKLPLIIYAHPDGATDKITNKGQYVNLTKAIDHGFAFMSIQYRHPRASQKYDDVPSAPTDGGDGGRPPDVDARPSTDIAAAIQFARLNADQLQIDENNVFLVGQSKGSLVVLTGMMNDQIKTGPLGSNDEPYLAKSSKPGAVFGVQASATYLHDQIRTTFLKQKASTVAPTPVSENDGITALALQYPSCKIKGVFNYYCQYDLGEQTVNNPEGFPMSAIDEMDADDPPLWLRYDRKPVTSNGLPTGTLTRLGLFMYPAGSDQTKTDIDEPDDCYATNDYCLDVHHPNFGVKLTQQYKSLPSAPGSKLYVYGQYANTSNAAQRTDAGLAFYENYWCFFLNYKPIGGPTVPVITGPGENLRVAGIRAYNDQFDNPDDHLSEDSCTMKESTAWQQ